MTRFLRSRLLQAGATLIGVLILVFCALRLTGDPTLLLVPEGATAEQIADFRHRLGFDRSLPGQFADYIGRLTRFDLGESIVQRLPVATIIGARLPYSLALSLGAFAFALCGGLVLGLLLATTRGQWVRFAASALVLTGQSMPTFLSGLILILVFAVGLGWLPSSGATSPQALIMPVIALGAYSMAVVARMVMTALREELERDYVRACRARGLPDRIILGHVMRNALPAILAIAALEAGNLFAGTIIVETVFAWPGIGQLMMQSVQSRDFMVVQALVLLVACVYLAVSVVSDLARAAVDPRFALAPR